MTIAALKNAFGDCCMLSSNCEVKSSYEVYNISTLFIKDQGPQLPVIICDKSECELTVIKKSNDPIHLVKMDSCLIPHSESKCDCILFNTSKLFLIELKTSCVKQRKDARKDAVTQLTNTLELLRRRGVPLSQNDVQAIICFRSDKTYPVMASRNAMRAKMYEDYRVWLNEGNEVIF